MSTKNVKEIVKKLQLFHGKGHSILYENKKFQVMICYHTLFIIDNAFYSMQFNNFVLKPNSHIDFCGKKIKNISNKTIFIHLVDDWSIEVFFKFKKKIKDFLSDQKIFYHWRKFIYLFKNQEGKFLGLYEIFGKRYFFNKIGRKCIDKIERDSSPFH